VSLTDLHASDIQYGKPYLPAVGDAFVDFAQTCAADLIVVAGDLTQRAKAAEYQAVSALLGRLPAVPCVVTPGNHDVPLYRFWERAFDPYLNWRRHMTPDLDTVTRAPGATVVALNSSAPRRTIVAGRVDAPQVDFARRSFAEIPQGDARILVIHHHFIATPDRQGGSVLPGGAGLLAAFEEMGVDVILGGHVHQTHFTNPRGLVSGDGPGIPLVACGTTASRRGRGPEAGRNTLNVVRLTEGTVEVTSHAYDQDRGSFVAGASSSFPRPGAVGSAGGGA
jgi:3',5'-cyclic AMP phosphodiesterase CpdA